MLRSPSPRASGTAWWRSARARGICCLISWKALGTVAVLATVGLLFAKGYTLCATENGQRVCTDKDGNRCYPAEGETCTP
jgi:hypothetical protein